MLTLDSLSLLLSKQNPTQASVTLSQQLRDMVGIGTLGSDKLNDSNATAEKTKDEETVAIGWTLMEINKTRDAAQEASVLLEKEMEAEGKYWEGVMAVKKAGWSICKVPHERHTLGVRFGFSEGMQRIPPYSKSSTNPKPSTAAPEFKSNGLAAMRRLENGSVDLDCGRLGRIQERIVVSYMRDNQVTGRATLHDNNIGSDPSLEHRVLGARNTIFAQELWGELVREARTLAAYDVRPDDKKLTCEIEPGVKLVIELLPTDQAQNDPAASTLPDNTIAETISASLHILLTYAHRCNELVRIRPMPPHISRSRGPQTYTLLRPIIARIMSARNTASCTAYVGGIVSALKLAGLSSSSFTLRTTQASTPTAAEQATFGSNTLSGAVSLIRNILQPIDVALEVNLVPDLSFTIRARTYLFPVTATYYHVLAPPESPLHSICAPYAEGYPDVAALGDYLRTATQRALVGYCLSKISSEDKWAQSIHDMSISDANATSINVRFRIEEADGKVTGLVVESKRIDQDDAAAKTWIWSNAQATQPPSLLEVVGEALGEKLS